MKKTKLLTLFCALATVSFGQFTIESGATVTLQGAATLVLEDVDFVNQGSLDAQTGSKVMFTGTSNNSLTSNGDDIYDLEISKDGADVQLLDDLTVSNSLSFGDSGNKLDIAANDLILEAAATVTGADASHYVQADGAGYMEKKYSAAGAFTYPVGDAANYSPLASNFTGALGATPSIKTKVTASAHPNLPGTATDYIARYWDVEATGITSYSNTVTGTYVAGDVTGTAASVKGASYGTSWSYAGAAAGSNTATGTLDGDDRDFTGSNFFGQVNLQALLQGAYFGGSMTTALNSGGHIPLTSPYADAPLTVASIPAGVTDWVKLEVRNAATPSTVVSKHSAFIKSDGSIVDGDGTSLPLLKDADPTAYIAIYHRNHLPIRSATTLDLVTPTLFDFTANVANAYNDGTVPNDPMADLGGGVYGMIGGNADGDDYVAYLDAFIPPVTFIDSDALEIFSVLGNVSNAQLTGYHNADLNMDGYVAYLDAFIPPVTFIDSDALEIFSILGNVSNAQLKANID